MNRSWCDRPGVAWGWRQRSFAWGRPRRGYFGGSPFPAQLLTPESEKEVLEQRSLALKSELEAIDRRLNEIASQEKAP